MGPMAPSPVTAPPPPIEWTYRQIVGLRRAERGDFADDRIPLPPMRILRDVLTRINDAREGWR